MELARQGGSSCLLVAVVGYMLKLVCANAAVLSGDEAVQFPFPTAATDAPPSLDLRLAMPRRQKALTDTLDSETGVPTTPTVTKSKLDNRSTGAACRLNSWVVGDAMAYLVSADDKTDLLSGGELAHPLGPRHVFDTRLRMTDGHEEQHEKK